MNWHTAALTLAFAPDALALRRAIGRAGAAQDRVRAAIGRRLRQTEYGQSLRLPGGPLEWERVPICDYDRLEPWLTAQRETEASIVTPDRVLFYEKTSGSSGAAKWIPYTRGLLGAFRHAFAAWSYDLLRNTPGLGQGKLYLSITPPLFQEPATTHGRPVGLTDDRDYLAPAIRRALAGFVVDTSALCSERDPGRFRTRLAARLLEEPELEVISIWNPSFLSVLLDRIAADRAHFSAHLAGARRSALWADPIDWGGIWPKLKLISAWDAGAAAPLAEALRRRLPGVWLQGKGLLATEAPLTIPLHAAAGFVPLVDSVLFEFEDDQGRVVGVEDTIVGKNYELIISTLGGLYRYRIGDRVEVRHVYRDVPCLDFVGRARATSDLVGEKLNEGFVRSVLDRLGRLGRGAQVSTLIPSRRPRDHYVWLLDRAEDGVSPEQLASALDEALQEAHHYRLARALGQLDPPRVAVRADGAAWVSDFLGRRGIRIGDAKPTALIVSPADAALEKYLEARA